MEKIITLANHLGLNKTQLKEALTHFSFYEQKNENKGNGRYVFAGMFIFRGILAKSLVSFYPGSGTQLQHTLGNLLRNDKLHSLFDKWKLMYIVRAGEKLDIKKHKHVFVYGILGMAALQLSEDEIQKFISRWFLHDNEHTLKTGKTKNMNFRGQADFLAKSVFGEKLVVNIDKKDELFYAEVSTKNGILLAGHTSKSYRYAQNKALKNAVALMAEMNMKDFEATTDYIERLKKRIEHEKGVRLQALNTEQSVNALRRAEAREKAKRLKAIKDEARTKAKAQSKERQKTRIEAEAKKKVKKLKTDTAIKLKTAARRRK